MPEWLQKNENYMPREDKDTFINKSILSFLALIARIKAQDKKEDRFQANAFFRVLFTLMLVVFVSVSRTFSFIYLVIAYLLLLLCFMPGREIAKILRTGLVMTLFTAIILLPTVFYGNTYSIFIIPVKVLVSIIAVNILSYATRWDQITIALKRFHVPDLMIFILDITLKYIVMLGEFSVEMLYALRLRSVGKNAGKYNALSGVAGTLFLKSRDMAEDMYAAMECRGFTGEYRICQKFRFGLADAAYLLINAGIIYIFIRLY
ncbi:cobalt/nickel transport system permease protein [Sporobacter termitidis DSM 10068]|uniref:Cobalt/nickel transport system permease protein n=1 Tax=Sporobacter termitidis DSM 10068 TaxID=1123282 RepID=A0A1M5XGP6_9FIRM|nr:energy-coupling factor transporter transmembrane component T [Sporobacter termitidis]SHH99007.1 cobalt/nickel transport system permease protein [Sporobacter termitidis DSM 10068]